MMSEYGSLDIEDMAAKQEVDDSAFLDYVKTCRETPLPGIEGTYDRLAKGNEGGKRLATVVDWLCDVYSLGHDDVASIILDNLEDALDIIDPFDLAREEV